MRSLGKFPDPFQAGIEGQPDAIRRAAAGAADARAALSSIVDRPRRGRLVFIGMGSSYDACYPAITELAGHGVDAAMLDAAETLHFRLPWIGADDVVVLVSQSGESAETVAVGRALRARARAPRSIGVTNAASSTLAGLVDEVFDTRAGDEEGPSTMTFAAATVVLAAIARTATGSSAETVLHTATAAAASIERMLADDDLPDRLLDWHRGHAATVILARGAARAAAEMAALTLKEAAALPVEAMQAAQFRHGPLELAGPELAAIVIATEPETSELDLGLAADLRGLGAAVLTLTQDDRPDPGVPTVRIGSLDRLVAPAAAIVPAQLLAWRLAIAAGRTPGTFLHATKVTSRE